MVNYADFFKRLTGKSPLPYQRRLHDEPSDLTVVSVPTGLGKTDAVIVDWLERLPTTRLAYCLPGRALTRQVCEVARKRVGASGRNVRVIELMGGSSDNDVTLGPDEPVILIGTQDILISRALNRGYARSPFRWPIDFALLNNDVQWVFDEVQLLGDALATSTQLAAFRARFRVFGQAPCVWMSATFDPRWLDTVDFDGQAVRLVTLDAEDRSEPVAERRLQARKSLSVAPHECRLPKGCAQFLSEHHQDGSLSVVIANTVERAREICEAASLLNPVLLHSRFRPGDRDGQLGGVLNGSAGVVISTQVIEAGIDLDADLLITDIAPWSSLVQRFGRVNRYGERGGGRVFWVDRPLTQKKKAWATVSTVNERDVVEIAAPYSPAQIEHAAAMLRKLDSASPADLPALAAPPPYDFVLRRTDLCDLFDTTPDLAGNHVDVSRFVRSGKEHDVYIAWRMWDRRADPPQEPRVEDAELCPVPLSKPLRDYVKRNGAWMWRHTRTGRWEATRGEGIFPGMTILCRAESGGYIPNRGWSPESAAPVPAPGIAEPNPLPAESSHDDDPRSTVCSQSLAEHTADVAERIEDLISSLNSIDLASYRDDLRTAALRHDWGKAHPVFQQTLHNLTVAPVGAPAEILAKQVRHLAAKQHSRPRFRHELASALAMLSAGDSDLAAYVAAAHHGKVRLNIRSMPGEKNPENGARIARGIGEDDLLFPVTLGGAELDTTVLSLRFTELGRSEGTAGWTDRVLRLLDKEGPFRLAFLEMMLRIADERASAARAQA